MRILYVCADPGIPVLGAKGASVHVRNIIDALVGRGHHVVLGCAALGAGNPAPGAAAVVELNEADDDQLFRLMRTHRVEAVIERYSLASGPARRASSRAGVPFVLEVNAPLVLEATRHRGLTDTARWLAWEREVFASADAIGVVSSALARYVSSVAPDATPRWVPNGVDVAMFEAAAPVDLALAGDAVTIGFVGSMKAWHGVVELVQAVADLGPSSPAQLVVAGTGPQAGAIAALVAQNGLGSRTCLLGEVAHAQIPSVLGSLDIGAAPYSTDDDFYFSPLKVLEYLAAGLPVVCPSAGDLPALVGDAGVLYPADERSALVDALRVLVDDPEGRGRAAASARARAAHLTWDSNAKAYEELVLDAGIGQRAVTPAGSP